MVKILTPKESVKLVIMTRFFRDKQPNVNNATFSQSCSGTNTKVTQSVKCVTNQWLKCLLNVHWLLPFILSNHKVVTSKWIWTPHACLSQWQWRLIGTSKQMQNHPDSTSKPTKGNQTVKYQVCTYMIYSYAPTIKHTGKKFFYCFLWTFSIQNWQDVKKAETTKNEDAARSKQHWVHMQKSIQRKCKI